MQSPNVPPPIPSPDSRFTGPPTTPPGQAPPRGGCLTAFLILVLIVNPLMALFYLAFGSNLAMFLPGVPSWFIPAMGIGGLLNFVFAIGIWNRKLWGAYGFFALSALIFIANVVYLGIGQSLSGLVGVGIMLALLNNEWDHMT